MKELVAVTMLGIFLIGFFAGAEITTNLETIKNEVITQTEMLKETKGEVNQIRSSFRCLENEFLNPALEIQP